MRKKILSVALILGTLANFAFTVASAEAAEKSYKIEFLEKMGITEKIDKSSYNANVSREDFAYYIANANGFDTNYSPANRKFIDVPLDSFAFSHIDALYTHGIVSQSGDGNFRPKDSITYGEAYTMILNSLGYKELASMYGAWPQGYVSIAAELEIDMGAASENVTYTEAMELIYEALQLNMYEANPSGINVTYEESDEAWITRAFDIEYAQGTVESLYGGTLFTDTLVKKNQILISGEQYSVSEDFDESEFLGSFVKYFYTEDDEEIVFMCCEDIKLEDYTVDVELFKEYKNGQMVIYRDESFNKTETVDLEDEHIIVYNGMPLSTKISETLANLSAGKGTVTFKDSDNDRNFDVVIIENFRNFYINSYDLLNLKLYNKLEKNDVITLEDKEYYEIILNGVAIPAEELPVNSVLSVAQSINGDMVKIVVGDEYFDGTLTAINEEQVTIDGKDYDVEESFKDVFQSTVSVGGKYRFYLDNFGKIAYVGAVEERKMTYGYLVRANYIEDDDSVKFKIFTEKNEMVLLDAAKRVTIDGDVYKESSAIKAYFDDTYNKGKTKPQLIEFEQATDGKVTNIDTALVQNPYEDENYSLYPAYDASEIHWYQSGRFGLKALFGSSTITFYVPEEADAEDRYYSVASYTRHFVYNEASKAAEIYYRSKESGYVDVMVAKSNTTDVRVEAEPIMMLDRISKVVGADDEVVLELGGYYNGSYLTAQIEEEKCTPGIEKGDLVAVYKNDAGETVIAELVYDKSEGEVPQNFIDNGQGSLLYQQGATWGSENYYRSATQVSFGYALAKLNGGVVSWSTVKGGAETERAALGSLKVTVYDAESDTVYSGDYTEIIDYDQDNANPSRLFFHTYLGVTRGMFVYK